MSDGNPTNRKLEDHPWWDRMSIVGVWIMVAIMFVLATAAVFADRDRRLDSQVHLEALVRMAKQNEQFSKQSTDELKFHNVQMAAHHAEILKRITSIELRLVRMEKKFKDAGM